MAKRMIVTLGITLAILAGLGFVKFKQIQTAIAQGAAFQPPPESGQAIHAGDVLAVLDTRQERAQLAALEAQRELARLTFDRMQGLLNERVVSQAELDRATADYRQTDARVGEVRAVIDRKTIRAPFSGILGIRQVNLGQYLAGGAELVELQSLNPIYVNFSVPQQSGAALSVGRTLRITANDTAVEGTGRVTAIDSKVDEATRNIQVQATFANPKGALRPGMFVQTEVVLGPDTGAPTEILRGGYGSSPAYAVLTVTDGDGKRVWRMVCSAGAGPRLVRSPSTMLFQPAAFSRLRT